MNPKTALKIKMTICIYIILSIGNLSYTIGGDNYLKHGHKPSPVSTFMAKDSDAETIEACKQAIRKNTDNSKAHFYLGVTYLKSGMYKEAIGALEQVIRIKSDATSHYNLGFVYGQSGKYKEAIELYKRAIFIEPDYINAYNNLGNAYRELGMYKEAIGALKFAIKRSSGHAMSYYNLGLIYHLSNDKGSAVEQYDMLINLDFDLANKLFRLINGLHPIH